MTAVRELDEVTEAAGIARACLVEHFADWSERNGYTPSPGTHPTAGLCRGGAWGLREVLREHLPDWDWHLDGGWGTEVGTMPGGTLHPRDAERLLPGSWPGGMADGDGTFRGHFWVRGELDGEAVVVDVTADQFGYDEVTVADGDDPRYRSTFPPEEMEDHFRMPERAFGVHMAARAPAAARSPGM